MPCLKKLLLSIVAAATVVLAQNRAEALIIIDTFDDATPDVGLLAPPVGLFVKLPARPDDSYPDAGPLTGVIGGRRNAAIHADAGTGTSFMTLDIFSGSDLYLNMSSPTLTRATWMLDYLDLSPIDLTQGGSQSGIELSFINADHIASVTVTLDTTTLGTVSLTLPKAASASQDSLLFDFIDFSLPVTSSSLVTGIHVKIEGANDGDYGINLIQTYEGSSVPEPSTLGLAGLGLVGLTALGWRRRRTYLTQRS